MIVRRVDRHDAMIGIERTGESSRGRRVAGWALRVVGPAILLLLCWRVVDLDELGELLGDIRFPWALAALAVVEAIIVLRTVRWVELHHAFGLTERSFTHQLRASYATGFASLVLPQVLSPFSRLGLLLQDGERARPAATGAAVEKLLELAAYLAFGLYGALYLASEVGGAGWWAVGALALLCTAAAGYLARARLRSFAEFAVARLPGGEGGALLPELAALTRRRVAVLAGWSLAIALLQALLIYLLSRSLGVDLSFPFMAAAWGLIALSMLLPLSINGLGTREAVLVAAFHAAGQPSDAAVALGLLVVAVVFAGSAPGALEWLWRFAAGGRSVVRPANAPLAAAVEPAAGRAP